MAGSDWLPAEYSEWGQAAIAGTGRIGGSPGILQGSDPWKVCLSSPLLKEKGGKGGEGKGGEQRLGFSLLPGFSKLLQHLALLPRI